jgi:hypothetical protein
MKLKFVGVLFLVGASLSMSQASGGNVLVWATGESQPWGTSYLDTSGAFDSVTTIAASSLDFATLNSFDKVLYYSNSSTGTDPNAVGDVLADFADTGKRLVLATFSWANQGGNTLGGRIVSDEISPYAVAGNSLYSSVSMASNDASSWFDGVSSLNVLFHDDVSLVSGATSHGTYSDGESILATKGNVVGLNMFPNEAWGNLSGDYQRLTINALSGEPVPEPASMAVLALGAAAVARRRRNQA